MNTKLWVSISLIVFLILIVNILVFGLLGKSSSTDNSTKAVVTTITDKKSTTVTNKATTTQTNNQASNTVSSTAQNSNSPAVMPSPPSRRITRAS